MICIVLVAGYATRLYPLTENFPKPLLPLGGSTILDLLLDDIDTIPQVTSHVIISNHKFIRFFEEWKEKQNLSKDVTVLDDSSIDNEHRLGAVKDLMYAIKSLDINDDVLVIAGDNALDFSLNGFVEFALKKQHSCVMCYEENELAKQQKTAIISVAGDGKIVSYEEKPKSPKSNLAVPPFYYFTSDDVKRIGEAIEDGCNADAPGSFAAWLSKQTVMYAYVMPGKRYDIGDIESYEYAKRAVVKSIAGAEYIVEARIGEFQKQLDV